MKPLIEATLGSPLVELADQWERVFSGEEMGIPTGFKDLDSLVPGFIPGALYVEGARPAMGKTAKSLTEAAYVAIHQRKPVLFFSLEMSQLELLNRMACSEARLDNKRLRRGDLTEQDWAKLVHAYARLYDAPIWVNDDPGCTIEQIRKEATDLKNEVGELGLIVVDYIQLMEGAGGDNRQIEVSKISRGLKLIARELEVPVKACSQLNRGLEMRADKRPMLQDLRESGSIEQDADVVTFIYRDEVYNPDSQDRGTAEVIVAKHRNGPTGSVRLAFLSYCTRFMNMAHNDD